MSTRASRRLMQTWNDCWGASIRVTDERLAHILEHPEMANEKARIAQTLAQPDLVVQWRSDPDVRLYHRLYDDTAAGRKYLCAVVKWRDEDRFLITAFLTDQPKRGSILWTTE